MLGLMLVRCVAIYDVPPCMIAFELAKSIRALVSEADTPMLKSSSYGFVGLAMYHGLKSLCKVQLHHWLQG